MGEGMKPAPWFLEVDGNLQGPVTAEEIMKRLTDGTLALDSRIWDEDTQTWRSAGEVVQQAELDASSPTHDTATTTSGWQPPPRPTDLKVKHVVDSTKPPSEAEYFALINEQKATHTKAPAPHLQPRPSEERTKRIFNEPRTSQRTAPTETAATAHSPGIGEVVTEVETSWGGKVKAFYDEHKATAILVAALLLVFVGTYGAIHAISERKGRDLASDPAAKRDASQSTRQRARGNALAGQSASQDESGSDSSYKNSAELGSGKNRIPPRGGSAAFRAADRNNNERGRDSDQPRGGDQLREPAQFYSSAEEPDETTSAAAAPSAAPAKDTALTNDVVDPPAFMPPYDPNLDPNAPGRTPANEQPAANTETPPPPSE